MPDKTALLESRWAFDDDQNISDFRSRHRRWPLRDDHDSDAGRCVTITTPTRLRQPRLR
ncbi:hypothetical protein AB0M12_22270 [Nocardia vinacea]|uniref:hypothetical protein n=1 Tax=Nocardia vinacea TaxID=96468 RepID=UPI003440503B